MTLTDRHRTSLPIQTSLRRVPLRTKLVTSFLELVFAALTLISAASTYALHSYMIWRMYDQLHAFADTSVETATANKVRWSSQTKRPELRNTPVKRSRPR